MIWTVLAVSMAVVAIFVMAVAELLVGVPLFEKHRIHATFALALCGAVLGVVGLVRGRSRRLESEEDDEVKTFSLLDLRYWGIMLVALGIVTQFVQKLSRETGIIVQARTVAAETPVPVPPKVLPPSPKVPVVFPTLKLQGIILRTNNPMVIIGGRSYGVGETVGGVVIKEISEDGAVLEKNGAVQSLGLRDAVPGKK